MTLVYNFNYHTEKDGLHKGLVKVMKASQINMYSIVYSDTSRSEMPPREKCTWLVESVALLSLNGTNPPLIIRAAPELPVWTPL